VHPLLLVFIAVALGAVGQICLKQGMGGMRISGPLPQKLVGLVSAIFTPYVFCGLFLYAVSTLFWLTVLTTQELSYVYPMIAVGYVVVTVLSLVFLHEQVSPLRWLSLFIICVGVAMLALLGANRSQPGAHNSGSSIQTSQHTPYDSTP